MPPSLPASLQVPPSGEGRCGGRGLLGAQPCAETAASVQCMCYRCCGVQAVSRKQKSRHKTENTAQCATSLSVSEAPSRWQHSCKSQWALDTPTQPPTHNQQHATSKTHLPHVVQEAGFILIYGHRCGCVSRQHVDKALCHPQLLHVLPYLGCDVKQGDACQ